MARNTPTRKGTPTRLPALCRKTVALSPDRHPFIVYRASQGSEHSRRAVSASARRALSVLLTVPTAELDDRALAAFPWPRLRYPHVAAIRAALLLNGLSPATINMTLAHVRGIVSEAWKLGYMDADELGRIKTVARVKNHTLPAGRALSSGELSAIFKACADDPTPAGARDAGLFAVLYVGGLRRSEIARLERADYDAGELRVRSGKGRKDRIVYIDNGGAEALEAWLEIRGTDPGALFHPLRKGGRIERRAMTPQAIRNVCTTRAAQAGVKHFTPHDLRRTFVSDLLDAGADISAVQRLAGHANVNTTLRYDRRPEDAKRQAAARLHVPYTRPRGAKGKPKVSAR